MKRYRQDPPFAVQIELAEGCNLRCSFCGLNGIREAKQHNFKFMTKETLRSVMTQMVDAGWNPRVEFAMHGEPTMHPEFVEMIAVAREAAPKFQLMMTSNGGGLVRKPGPERNIIDLFKAGLNVLALDDYDGVKFVDKAREALFGTQRDEGVTSYTRNIDSENLLIQGYEYPQNKDGSPHARRGRKDRVVVFIQDISKARKGNHSLLNNHAGAGAPRVGPDHPTQTQRCAKPFREMSVRWDGNVAISCNDWRGVYKCGNVVRDGLDRVWNGPEFNAARRKLYHGMRDFDPCRGCDAVSYRVGLLPDKFGKVKLPKPTKEDLEIIKRATSGDPYTTPVRRPWEK